jgi:hypothetical protein
MEPQEINTSETDVEYILLVANTSHDKDDDDNDLVVENESVLSMPFHLSDKDCTTITTTSTGQQHHDRLHVNDNRRIIVPTMWESDAAAAAAAHVDTNYRNYVHFNENDDEGDSSDDDPSVDHDYDRSSLSSWWWSLLFLPRHHANKKKKKKKKAKREKNKHRKRKQTAMSSIPNCHVMMEIPLDWQLLIDEDKSNKTSQFDVSIINNDKNINNNDNNNHHPSHESNHKALSGQLPNLSNTSCMTISSTQSLFSHTNCSITSTSRLRGRTGYNTTHLKLYYPLIHHHHHYRHHHLENSTTTNLKDTKEINKLATQRLWSDTDAKLMNRTTPMKTTLVAGITLNHQPSLTLGSKHHHATSNVHWSTNVNVSPLATLLEGRIPSIQPSVDINRNWDKIQLSLHLHTRLASRGRNRDGMNQVMNKNSNNSSNSAALKQLIDRVVIPSTTVSPLLPVVANNDVTMGSISIATRNVTHRIQFSCSYRILHENVWGIINNFISSGTMDNNLSNGCAAFPLLPSWPTISLLIMPQLSSNSHRSATFLWNWSHPLSWNVGWNQLQRLRRHKARVEAIQQQQLMRRQSETSKKREMEKEEGAGLVIEEAM